MTRMFTTGARWMKALPIAAALVCAVADPGFAQPTSEPTAQPSLKLGPFELWPTMAIRNIGVDNNVFNEAEDAKRDFTATVAPNLTVVVRPSWMRLSYTTISE